MDLRATATWLLGRPLTEEDGVPEDGTHLGPSGVIVSCLDEQTFRELVDGWDLHDLT